MLEIIISILYYREIQYGGSAISAFYIPSGFSLPSGNIIIIMHGPWPSWDNKIEYNTIIKLDTAGQVISYRTFGINNNNRMLEISKIMPYDNYSKIIAVGFISFDAGNASVADPVYIVLDTNLNVIAFYNLEDTYTINGMGFNGGIMSTGQLAMWGQSSEWDGGCDCYYFSGAFFSVINVLIGVSYFWKGPKGVSQYLNGLMRAELDKRDVWIGFIPNNYNNGSDINTSNRGKFNLFLFDAQNPYSYLAKSWRLSIFVPGKLIEWIGLTPFYRIPLADPEYQQLAKNDIFLSSQWYNGSQVDILPEDSGFLMVASGGVWYDSTVCRGRYPYQNFTYVWRFVKNDRIVIMKFGNASKPDVSLKWMKRLVFPGIDWHRGDVRISQCRRWPSGDTLRDTFYIRQQIQMLGVVKINSGYIIGALLITDSTGNSNYAKSNPILIKIDTLGNFQWGYKYDFPSNTFPVGTSVENPNRGIFLDSKGYIIMHGALGPNIFAAWSAFLIKFDTLGNSCLNKTPINLLTENVDWAVDDPGSPYNIGPTSATHNAWGVSYTYGLNISGQTCVITPVSSSEDKGMFCYKVIKNKIVFNDVEDYEIYKIDGSLYKKGRGKEVDLNKGIFILRSRGKSFKVYIQ
ncbi:MAG: hypothetical protein ABIL47_03495 [candidate division WOR-3 bacterium]